MDLQYAPIVLAASNHRVMQAIIAEVARAETGRPVFTLHIDAPLDRGRAARRRTRLLGRTAQLDRRL